MQYVLNALQLSVSFLLHFGFGFINESGTIMFARKSFMNLQHNFSDTKRQEYLLCNPLIVYTCF